MQVDRQTLLFFIIMFIFLSLPNGGDQPHSSRERETLTSYDVHLKESRETLNKSEYHTGYGNLTGLELSYLDNFEGKTRDEWPLHKYSRDHPWIEDEKYSLLPNLVSNRVKLFWGNDPIDESDDDEKAYLFNISGRVYGEFVKEELPELKRFNFRLPELLETYVSSFRDNSREGESEGENDENSFPTLDNNDKLGNITFSSGRISVHLKNYDYNFRSRDLSKFISNEDTDLVDDAVLVNLSLDLVDFPEIHRNELDAIGVYFQDSGSLIAITSTGKFLGEYGLPHFTLNGKNFNRSKLLIGQFLNMTSSQSEITMDFLNDQIETAVKQCEFISFIQLEKTEYSSKELRNIDDELKSPIGRPIPSDIPKIRIKEALLYSPDCGIVLKSAQKTPFVGDKSEVLYRSLKSMMSLLFLLVGTQLLLILRQVKRNQTPGQLSMVSTSSLSLLAFMDSLVVILLLFLSPFTENLYLIFSSVAVLAFVLCVVFEVRFIVNASLIQSNENGTTWWEILRGSTNNSPSSETSDGDIQSDSADNGGTSRREGANTATGQLPPPVTANPEPTANEEAQYSNSIFAGGSFFSLIFAFLILNVLRWRVAYRRRFEYFGLFFLYSFWIPQFLRNTIKNRRRPFTWEFLTGTSIVRLVPIWYFCLYASNPLRHHKDPLLAYLLTFWICLQLLFLYLQQRIDPRFWIDENWLPKAYDYHPLLTISDLETGFASDMLSSVDTLSKDTLSAVFTCSVDCAICMSSIPLQISINDINSKTKSNIDRSIAQAYMITPCHHIFHTNCLEDWMKYKLQCPVCRNPLPPL